MFNLVSNGVWVKIALVAILAVVVLILILIAVAKSKRATSINIYSGSRRNNGYAKSKRNR